MLVVNLILILVVLQELHNPHCVAYKPDSRKPLHLITPTIDPRREFYEKIGWKKPINPWLYPLYNFDLYFVRHHNVVIFVININNFLGSNREQTYIATGVFISSTRVLTSFNPFKNFLQDPEVVSKTLILSVHYFWHDKMYGPAYFAPRADTIQCGREVMPLPDDADVFYIDKEKLYSPLHDLMVFRVSEPKECLPFSKYDFYLNFSKKWRFWNMSMPVSPIASPINSIPGRLEIVGLGFKNETEVKNYNKMFAFTLIPNPVDVLDCDNWIPREWGYFICIRNFIGVPVLPSGAVLIQRNVLVFGIGSFMLTRNGEEILVFTDVRPYRNQILHTCSVYEFEDTPHEDMWW